MSFRVWLIRLLGGTPNDPRNREILKGLPTKFGQDPGTIRNVPGYMSVAAAVSAPVLRHSLWQRLRYGIWSQRKDVKKSFEDQAAYFNRTILPPG